jgi:hypothetical protein
MGRGGYNGGSTLMGPGRGWLFDPDFDVVVRDKKGSSDDFLRPVRPKKPKVGKPKIMAGGKEIGERVLRKHRMAKEQGLDRDVVLLGLCRPLAKRPQQRQMELKRLVAEKILLPTGAINLGHPAVAAWLKINGKNKKQHV